MSVKRFQAVKRGVEAAVALLVFGWVCVPMLPAGTGEESHTQLFVRQADADYRRDFPEAPKNEKEAADWAAQAVLPFQGFGRSLVGEMGKDLIMGGEVWARTLTTPFDPTRSEETYKVYTQILDFAGKEPITKGSGGKYPHHRGMFIGWKDTLIGEQDYDTWHMSNCTQRHVRWVLDPQSEKALLNQEEIAWCDEQGEPFIFENRVVLPHPGLEGMRNFDFETDLVSSRGKIRLRGDLQHAGMQVRMANEVSEHPQTTQYILPAGSERHENDEVTGAWWACCSTEVGGKRYWLVHMTPPDHPTGVPVYSIRDYARFGAFFEPDLDEGRPLRLRFRVAVSEKELDQSKCQALYEAFAQE